MEKRFAEITARKAEIKALLEGEGQIDLNAIETELEALGAEEAELRKKAEIVHKINEKEVRTKEIKKPEEEMRKMEKGFESMEYRQAFMDYVKTGRMGEELRAVTTTADAGAVIPTVVMDRIVEKMENVGHILPLVTRTNYASGLAIPVSSVKPVATWVAEGATSTVQSKAVGSVVFAAYKLRCAVGITLELETMSIAAFETAIVNNIAEAMTKALEAAILLGTGTGQPKGILTETAPAGQSVDVTAINYEALIDAESALPAAYETESVYLMTKKTFMAFVGMVDTDGQPIARVNYGIGGAPERVLLGRKVIINDYMTSFDAAATGDVFAAIFRLEDYVLNAAYNVTLKQYEDNLTEDIVRKAIMLADGKAVDTNSLVLLKKA